MAIAEKAMLCRVQGVALPPSLSSLKTAEEVSAAVRMSAARLMELAEACVVSHFRIDGGPPLFSLADLKSYVRQYLTAVHPGAPLPIDLRPIMLRSVENPVPLALAMVQERLCECPIADIPPCVYFLIENDAVLYIGQSRNLPARLSQHSQDGKRWNRVLFLPVPAERLLEVETEWIRTLQPPMNRTGNRNQDRVLLDSPE